MAAPKGNQFWKIRSRHGRDKLFASPKLLWQAACNYFEWIDEHPWDSIEVKVVGGEIEKVNNPRKIPYTLEGLCLYINCSTGFFRTFKTDKEKCTEEFLAVIENIEKILYDQKFTGASAGYFNANIIARSLGMVDKVENINKNFNVDMTKDDINKLDKELDDAV